MEENQSFDQTLKKRDPFLPASIIVAAIVIAGAVIYSTGQREVAKQPALLTDNEPAAGAGLNSLIDDDVVLGDSNAPVEVVEFGDYQCPFCGRFFNNVEPRLISEYVETGKVKFVYRDFAFLGPESLAAALASQCAAEQGKFWEYHDKLFRAEITDGRENNGNLSPAFMKSLAAELGLNGGQFARCLDTRKYQTEIDKDYEDGVANGVNGTPATFVSGKLMSGALPYSVFKSAIDNALKGE